MTASATAKSPQPKPKFMPNMENCKTSLMYEGLALNKADENLTIEELKRKYAKT
ncbi:hypothetical protein [Shewanella sp.]|uniref:hypothetical protein n=1 Tax=Shewanella sp. TaxID=50422 RepID=UPI003A97DFEF